MLSHRELEGSRPTCMSLRRAREAPSSREKRAGFLHQKSPLVEISGYAVCHSFMQNLFKFCTDSNSVIAAVIVKVIVIVGYSYSHSHSYCCKLLPLLFSPDMPAARTTLKKVRGAIGKKPRRLCGYNIFQKEWKSLVKNCHT